MVICTNLVYYRNQVKWGKFNENEHKNIRSNQNKPMIAGHVKILGERQKWISEIFEIGRQSRSIESPHTTPLRPTNEKSNVIVLKTYTIRSP